MVWREGGKYPHVVIELLSNSTATVDRTTKKDLYQDVWRLPNYFWFHPYTKEFQGFKLVEGKYQALEPNQRGYLWSDPMELFLGMHEDGLLRLFDAEGALVLLEEEEARSREQQALQQAEQERQRAEQMAAKLRELGIDPDAL